MELEQLVGAHPAREAKELREVTESRACLPRSGPSTPDRGVAACRPHESARDLDQRRLPRPVRSEEADELALADLEVDAPERVRRPVLLVQVADRKRVSHYRRRLRASRTLST
jgi:hypothetical protein